MYSLEMDSWNLLASGSLEGRSMHSAVWDQKKRAMIIFAGQGASLLGDLWRYGLNASTWVELIPQGPFPPARSDHAAVWDETSYSMFILGGWGGSLEFLNDLWIYRWEADIWMQLSPYTSGPTTRRGHVAVWDPVSKSILLHAGAATFEATSNSSETSSHGATSYYSSELWNYSTLSNVWTQMALDSVSGTPSGRMDHAAVWDPTSRGMLVLGGFNVSYLFDLWRYVALPTNAIHTAECDQGQICTVEMREFVPETFRGTYRVCWCRPDPAAQVACGRLSFAGRPVTNSLPSRNIFQQHSLCSLPSRFLLSWRRIA
ncbi:unnamed protein product [Durusdinium trenchii]